METLVEPTPAALLHLPQSPDELDEETVLRIPATYEAYEEYLNALDTISYTIQFIDGEILIMGQATETHEQLVASSACPPTGSRSKKTTPPASA